VIVTAAVRVPVAVGVNVTLTVQLALGPKLVGQLFVCAKSPAFVPVIVMPSIVMVDFGSKLVSVIV
jgi:hypothetical protein